jgi:hypothetical protein
MTALSSLAIRVCAEINDATSNTFSASIGGTLYNELQQYCVDGIKDFSNYSFRETLDYSIVTSANRRSYVVSALAPEPEIIKRVEYVDTSTSITNIPDFELFGGTLYLFQNDQPLFTNSAGKYFNIWYLGRHDIPSAGSAQITVSAGDEELIVNYAKAKACDKYALDQRGINQDTSNEFVNLARDFERRYKEGVKRSQTTFTTYKG